MFEHMVGVLKTITHGRKEAIHRSIANIYQRTNTHLIYTNTLLFDSTTGKHTNLPQTYLTKCTVAAKLMYNMGLRDIITWPDCMR
jgi:hypothetical protein